MVIRRTAQGGFTQDGFVSRTSAETTMIVRSGQTAVIGRLSGSRGTSRIGADGAALSGEAVRDLRSALRGDDRENLAEEFADVIAWLTTIANVAEIDLNAALVAKYGGGCPGCGKLVCECPDSEKP